MNFGLHQAPTWSDDDQEFVKTQWAAGASASTIAGGLTNRSRNAVLSLIHRKGFPRGVPSTPRSPGVSVPRGQPPKRSKTEDFNAARLASKMRAAAEQPAEIPETTFAGDGVTLYELTNTTCRWPRGDAEIRYCGASANLAADKPYCVTHRKMAYEPPKARAERQSRTVRGHK